MAEGSELDPSCCSCGTQWYILFNVIAGASAIPTDLKEVCGMFRLGNLERWRKLFLPGIFPYLITGFITASGGAWNASIVAEYFHFRGQTLSTVGLGAVISHATDTGTFPRPAGCNHLHGGDGRHPESSGLAQDVWFGGDEIQAWRVETHPLIKTVAIGGASRAKECVRTRKDEPQRLKPGRFHGTCGTAEAVP